MDQGGPGRGQMDPAFVPLLRRQRCPAPCSCARVQSGQFPTDAGDAGADQRLVADKPPGEADQDRRKGRQTRPLCRLPDGGGRDPEKPVRRHPAAHRRTATASGGNSVMSSICLAFHQKPRETCVLMTEIRHPRRAAASGSAPNLFASHRRVTRHFSLVKVSLWTQSQPR
jgi:hypothetical protein